MLGSYNKRDLNMLEYILYHGILGILYWLIISFIVSIQDYILKKFSFHGLDLLLHLCPILIFYWFMQVTSQKIKIKGSTGYSKLIPFLVFIVTLSGLVWFLGFLKFSL